MLLPEWGIFQDGALWLLLPERPENQPAAPGVAMQVLCKRTDGDAEFHCCVCGQGFVLFWDRQSHAERAQLRHEIQESLRLEHRSCPGPEAHPQSVFLAPEWKADDPLPPSAEACPVGEL